MRNIVIALVATAALASTMLPASAMSRHHRMMHRHGHTMMHRGGMQQGGMGGMSRGGMQQGGMAGGAAGNAPGTGGQMPGGYRY